MKKFLSLLLTLTLITGLFCTCTFAETNGIKLSLNGEVRSLVAYNIKDNNYFKLRDIANLLKGTEAEFDVIWNESRGAIELLTNTPYSTNEALTSETLKNPVATSSYVPIFKDGATVFLGAYNIADNNYFKLRDVAAVIDFGVDWDEVNEVINIDTKNSYIYPTSSSFGLNTKYLSFFGKTKAEVDRILGNGSYSYEWGMTTYSNDLMVGWNSIGVDPSDDNCAMSMYIPLRELFFACPATLTKDQIISQFNTWEDGYSEMDDESVLLVNYCGNTLMFFPDYGLTGDSYAFINNANPYINPNTDVIQITNSAETSDISSGQKTEINFAGRYETPEWVDGSYIEVRKNGDNYDVEYLLVRGASGENCIGKLINDYQMLVIDSENPFENLILEWSDSNNLSILSTDTRWQYMVASYPIHFYRK